MKRIIPAAITMVAMCACAPKVTVTVTNPLDFDRATELVEIPVERLAGITLGFDSTCEVRDAAGKVIPSQWTHDDLLVFPSGVGAHGKATFTIKAGRPQQFPTRAFGRLVLERKDDFAWENDRVAFRLYGEALIATDGPSNGLDIWYKRTPEMVIDRWYEADLGARASYHDDHGEGLDNYDVKRSLGAGAMAPWVGGKLWLGENFTASEVLDSGPLRVAVRLTYKNLDVDGVEVSESRVISLDAGSQLTKITQSYGITEPMKVAAGVVKREGSAPAEVAPDAGWMVYAEPPTPKASGVWVALLFPGGFEDITVDSYEVGGRRFSHTLAITTMQPGAPVTYFAGYGWAEWGFPQKADFENYLRRFAEAQRRPLEVNIR